MSLHLDTIALFRGNYYLVLRLSGIIWSSNLQYTNLDVILEDTAIFDYYGFMYTTDHLMCIYCIGHHCPSLSNKVLSSIARKEK